MSMYEVAAALGPYADFLLASELLEPGQGWDYTAIGTITQRQQAAGGALSAADVGAAIVEAYLASASEAGATGLTLALVDLAAHGRLQADMVALAKGLAAQLAGTSANGERDALCVLCMAACASALRQPGGRARGGVPARLERCACLQQSPYHTETASWPCQSAAIARSLAFEPRSLAQGSAEPARPRPINLKHTMLSQVARQWAQQRPGCAAAPRRRRATRGA